MYTLGVPDELLDEIVRRVALVVRAEASPETDRWLGVEEAAAYISAPSSRIYDLKAQGKLEFRKDGSRLLFRRSWLDAYLEV